MSENVKLPRVVPDPLVPEGVVLLLDDERGVRRVVEIVKENDALRAQPTAAEAAREAVAGEVREACAKVVEKVYGPWSVDIPREDLVRKWARETAASIRSLDFPTPSAALQRVREQEAERALRWAWYEIGHGDPRDEDGVDPGRDEFVAEGMTMLFPTPDAGGPA